MQLPFTHDQFLDVFGAYNTALWPAAVTLWLATIGVIALFYERGAVATRWVAGLLAVHWAWSGIAYHLVYFRMINPAALLFGALCVVQSAGFAWHAARATALRFTPAASGWAAVGGALTMYALAYPLLGLVFGLTFPRLPLFGVPCPTTILTVGFLLCASPRTARWLALIPVLWAAIGGSAAFVFGILADYALLGAGVLLVLFLVFPRRRTRMSAA
jgi:hypothetical protein